MSSGLVTPRGTRPRAPRGRPTPSPSAGSEPSCTIEVVGLSRRPACRRAGHSVRLPGTVASTERRKQAAESRPPPPGSTVAVPLSDGGDVVLVAVVGSGRHELEILGFRVLSPYGGDRGWGAVADSPAPLDPHLTPNGPCDPGGHKMTRRNIERLNPCCVRETGRHHQARGDRYWRQMTLRIEGVRGSNPLSSTL
jgi:hypothetical protein